MALEFGGYDERDETPKSKSRTPEHKEKVDPYPLTIPTTLTGLEVGKGEILAYEAPLMSHDIDKVGNVCTYNLRGLVSTNGTSINPDIVAKQFIENMNAFLEANNVIDVTFDISAGIGTSIAGTKYAGEYIARLTAKFTLADPQKLGNNRITKLEGISRYYVSDPTNGKQNLSTAHSTNSAVFSGYTTMTKTQPADLQAALFAFGYKLTKATTPVVVNTPPVRPNKPPEAYEALESRVSIGAKIDRLSTEGAVCVPILFDGKQVGSIVKCEAKTGWKPQAEFISAANTPQCFIKAGDSYFPDPAEINKYLQQTAPAGKQRKLTMITTGPCYQSGTTMAGVNYDSGKSVGHEESFTAAVTSGRGVATITNGGLILEHTDEFAADPAGKLATYKAQNRDIVTMSSLARVTNGELRLGQKPSLRQHDNAHSLVSFSDGKRGEVIVNDCDADTRKAVISSLMKNSGSYQIQRALYADSDASNDFLDGIWITDNTGSIRYSHPSSGDLFRNPNANPGPEVKNNMPGVMVYYAEQT